MDFLNFMQKYDEKNHFLLSDFVGIRKVGINNWKDTLT